MQELSKTSTLPTIESYFNGILQATRCGEEFPISLNDVWSLSYNRKDHAVRFLKENYIEGVDYIVQDADNQVFPKNGENPGGRPETNYKLTTACFEFFVAHKNLEVFEVYRKVFHKVANAVREGTFLDNVDAQIRVVGAFQQMLHINDASVAKMLNEIGAGVGAPQLEYVSSKGVVFSATTLLEHFGHKMKAHEFNTLAESRGYLTKKFRKSSKGQKGFWVITEEGLTYGENQVNPNNMKETQPLWYEDKFEELYHLLTE